MKEEEIRPQKIFAKYLQICEQDTHTYFAGVDREEIDCPACGQLGEYAFEKNGFDYASCPRCYTLYVSPRPAVDAFDRYYTESPSSRFWATTFYKETAEARREKVWKPKARMVYEALLRYGAVNHSIVDIGGGYGLFAETMASLSPQPITVIEPGPCLADVCRAKSLTVIEKFLGQVSEADLPSGPRVFVSFELFEHLHSPARFLEDLKGLMHTDDLFLFTTLSGTGIDIQLLWENSNSVAPPHHLNFLNPNSAKILLQRLGLDALDVSTPGKLDLDILTNNLEQIRDRFWRVFLATASETMKEQWQALLAESGWSSHMMVVCRKQQG